MTDNTNDNYFGDYNNLQRAKHDLIKEYLNGWYPKLGMWSGRILYLDTHSGRGQHASGESGSPVVAVQTLLEHSYRDQILKKSESVFVFIEENEDNVQILHESLSALGDLPKKVNVNISHSNCFEQLQNIIDNLHKSGGQLAPAFIFVDPYGFKVPCATLKTILNAGRVELFVNIIWRELHMGIGHAQRKPKGGMADTMTQIFGSEAWKSIDLSADVRAREDQTIDLLCDAYGADWVTSMRMLGDNGATRYILAHFTNHSSGRDLMKDCMWKVCPDGGFYARRSDNPDQTELISQDPDLNVLARQVLSRLNQGPARWSTLIEENLQTLWRETHLNKVIGELRKSGKIVASDFEGRFSKNKNPLLTLKE